MMFEDRPHAGGKPLSWVSHSPDSAKYLLTVACPREGGLDANCCTKQESSPCPKADTAWRRFERYRAGLDTFELGTPTPGFRIDV